MGDNPLNADLSAVPVFPLPSVVLLPTAVLPLHIFEPRYKAMTQAALRGKRRLAMALLSPGWKENYHARPAIEPVVCVGTILTHELLPEGKYNFLLQGHTRAKVVRELQTDEPFRRFALERIVEIPADEETLLGARQKFSQVFESGFLAGTPVGNTFAKLLNSPMRTSELADLVAFNCFDDLSIKQLILAESNVRNRVLATVSHLLSMDKPERWPPNSAYKNPSEN